MTVVGEPLVAKESRFVESNPEQSDRFVKRFCQIQRHTSQVASAFNYKLDSVVKLDPDTARVDFLPCSVYWLRSNDKVLKVIVEPRLFGKFQKWNSNNGWTKQISPRKPSLMPIKEEPQEAQPETTRPNDSVPIKQEEMSMCSEVIEIDDDECIFFTPDDVAQAFSHFSYVYSGRRLLICDLQGVYNRASRVLELTDPVIHHHDETCNKYGRTDRGARGIQDFLHTHVCNGLCELVTKGFFPVRNIDLGKDSQ
jgi:hypothetical protein